MARNERLPPGLPALLALLIAVALVFAGGCTRQAPAAPTPVPAVATPVPAPVTPEAKQMVTFTEKDNGSTVTVAPGQKFTVQLDENPTTGFMWNASTSPGLAILSSDFQTNAHPAGMVGVGGIRSWVLQANATGSQTFSAVYRRSWEPLTGNETAYTLAIAVS